MFDTIFSSIYIYLNVRILIAVARQDYNKFNNLWLLATLTIFSCSTLEEITTMASYQTYEITHTVLVGVLFLTGFFFCCTSFCFARMKRDPERRGMHFLKAAWVFFEWFV